MGGACFSSSSKYKFQSGTISKNSSKYYQSQQNYKINQKQSTKSQKYSLKNKNYKKINQKSDPNQNKNQIYYKNIYQQSSEIQKLKTLLNFKSIHQVIHDKLAQLQNKEKLQSISDKQIQIKLESQKRNYLKNSLQNYQQNFNNFKYEQFQLLSSYKKQTPHSLKECKLIHRDYFIKRNYINIYNSQKQNLFIIQKDKKYLLKPSNQKFDKKELSLCINIQIKNQQIMTQIINLNQIKLNSLSTNINKIFKINYSIFQIIIFNFKQIENHKKQQKRNKAAESFLQSIFNFKIQIYGNIDIIFPFLKCEKKILKQSQLNKINKFYQNYSYFELFYSLLNNYGSFIQNIYGYCQLLERNIVKQQLSYYNLFFVIQIIKILPYSQNAIQISQQNNKIIIQKITILHLINQLLQFDPKILKKLSVFIQILLIQFYLSNINILKQKVTKKQETQLIKNHVRQKVNKIIQNLIQDIIYCPWILQQALYFQFGYQLNNKFIADIQYKQNLIQQAKIKFNKSTENQRNLLLKDQNYEFKKNQKVSIIEKNVNFMTFQQYLTIKQMMKLQFNNEKLNKKHQTTYHHKQNQQIKSAESFKYKLLSEEIPTRSILLKIFLINTVQLSKKQFQISKVIQFCQKQHIISLQLLISYYSLKIIQPFNIKTSTQLQFQQKFKCFTFMYILVRNHYYDHKGYFNSNYCKPHLIMKWVYYITYKLLQEFKIFKQDQNYLKNNRFLNQIEVIKRIYQSLQIDLNHKIQQIQSLKININIEQLCPINYISGFFYNKQQIQKIHQVILSSTNLSQNSHTKMNVKKQNKNNKYLQQFRSNIQYFNGLINWGNNLNLKPDIYPLTKNYKVKNVECGSAHVVFSTINAIYGFGQNNKKQLGTQIIININDQQLYLLKKIQSQKSLCQISCGNQHTCILIDSQLYTFGQGRNKIHTQKSYNFDKIFCGGLHTIALKNDKAFSWGRGQGGQLGHPISSLKVQQKDQTYQYFIDQPTQIKGLDNIIKVTCGDAHTLFLNKDGIVYVTGYTYQGQLGLGITGDDDNFQIFQPVKLQMNQKIIDTYAGSTFSFFKSESGKLYGCGLNDCYQLGIQNKVKIDNKRQLIVEKETQKQQNILQKTINIFLNRVGIFQTQNSQSPKNNNKCNYRNNLIKKYTIHQKSSESDLQYSTPQCIQIFGEKTNLIPLSISSSQVHSLAIVQNNIQKTIMGWGSNKQLQLIQNQQYSIIDPKQIQSLQNLNIKQIMCMKASSWAIIQRNKNTKKNQKQQKLNDQEVDINIQIESFVQVLHY